MSTRPITPTTPASPKPKYFLSAVSSEFESLRLRLDKLLRELGFETSTMDYEGTDAGNLGDVLCHRIDECDGLIQIVGEGYGAEPPEPHPEHGRISYTQFEYLYARENGLRTFVLPATGDAVRDRPVDELDANPPEQKDNKRRLQREYRQRLETSNQLWHRFASVEELERKVATLRTEVDTTRRDYQAHQQKAERTGNRNLWIALASFVAVIVVGFGVWSLTQKVDEQTAIDPQKMKRILVASAEAQWAAAQSEADTMLDNTQRAETLELARQKYELDIGRAAGGARSFSAILGNADRSEEANRVLRRVTALLNNEEIPEPDRLDRFIETVKDERPVLVAENARLRKIQTTTLRANLELFKNAAEFAISQGRYDDAVANYRTVLDFEIGDPSWHEVRCDYVRFLLYWHGPRQAFLDRTLKYLVLQNLRENSDFDVDSLPISIRNGFNKGTIAIFTEAFQEAENLAREHQTNPTYKLELIASHTMLGLVAQVQRDYEEADLHVRAAEKILETLDASDLDIPNTQRLLIISEKLGNITNEEED